MLRIILRLKGVGERQHRAEHDKQAATSFHDWNYIANRSVEIRWDEKAGLRTGCGVRSQVIDVLEAQEIRL
jgi:hypothetical protein